MRILIDWKCGCNTLRAEAKNVITEIDNAKQHISLALEDILQEQSQKIRAKDARDFIVQYVFKGVEEQPGSEQRYEWYYQLMGQAIAIAQGWKLNSISALQDPKETVTNLEAYIKGTYGS